MSGNFYLLIVLHAVRSAVVLFLATEGRECPPDPGSGMFPACRSDRDGVEVCIIDGLLFFGVHDGAKPSENGAGAREDLIR